MNNYIVIFIVMVITAVFSSCYTSGISDSQNESSHKTETSLVSKSSPEFKYFPVKERFKGKFVQPNFSTNRIAIKFHAVIKDGAKKGPNFAGHLTVVTWGCGTSCQSGAIIDLETGFIYYPLPTASFGFDFRIDSKLLIVNPSNAIEEAYGSATSEIPDWLQTTYYIWKNDELVKYGL